jgi:hypothetical protein
MTMEDALKVLTQINGFLAVSQPMIAAAVGVGEVIANEFRSQGENIGPFAAEIAKFDAAVSEGFMADADWRARHGLPPAGA